MNRKRKADEQREGPNKRRKQSRGGHTDITRDRGDNSKSDTRGDTGGDTRDRSENRNNNRDRRQMQVDEEQEEQDTKVFEDDEAATIAKKIRGQKWRDQKKRLGLEEEEDSDASDEEGEGPALGQLGEEGSPAELGPNMMPFNVREELEGGDFDRGIGAVRRKEEVRREAMKKRQERGMVYQEDESEDDDDSEDAGDRAWYEEQETRARDDKHYYARIAANRPVVDDEDSSEDFDAIAKRKQLVQQLNYGENVFAAMRRLRPASEKKTKQERAADPNTQRFNLVVEIADQLMNHGFPNIYNDTRERIQEGLERDEHKTQRRGVRAAVQYEYRWGPQSETYGPYALHELQAWLDQGLFNEHVLARPVNSEAEFVPVTQLLAQHTE